MNFESTMEKYQNLLFQTKNANTYIKFQPVAMDDFVSYYH